MLYLVPTLVAMLIVFSSKTRACTNFLITPGASVDGSALVSYAADSGSLYGALGFYARANHSATDRKDVWDWDSGKYLGSIPEAPHTFKVVGNTNEFQLTIAETTFGGVDLGHQESAVMDYGNHIWTTLQRSRNASEAISVLDDLMQTYGWASDGESFSIADPHEVWLMEIVGKGANETGSVWVARKIPDGAVTGHANQARIRTFVLDDPSVVRFSPDVVDFARRKGLYNGSDADFSFSDVYDPLSFTGARLAEARVWSMFRQVVDDDGSFGEEYLDYVSGRNLSHRMPLFVYPKRKISLNDTMWFMRNHYESTAFDMRGDVGAEQWAASVRTRPLYWEDPDTSEEYHNERPVGVQQTGWHFVAQMRKWLPDPVGGVVWFGVDDAAHSVHCPFYVGTNAIPRGWADEGVQHQDDAGQGLTVTFDSAFWIFNMVANSVYARWADAHPLVQDRIAREEAAFFVAVAAMDEKIVSGISEGKSIDDAEREITAFCVERGTALLSRWLDLWKEMFFRFRDYFTVTAPSPQPENSKDIPWANVDTQGMKPAWRRRIVKDTGDKFRVPGGVESIDQRKLKVVVGL